MMLIRYQPNPLCSVVELDAHDLEKLRLKLIIEELEDRVYGADYHLQSGENFNPEAALRSLNVAGLEDEPFNQRVDRSLAFYTSALAGPHDGDCTCEPCSCSKCHAEGLLGIDTISGLSSHPANHIKSAFANERSLDEAIGWLADYKPIRKGAWLAHPPEEFERCGPRWREEAKAALAWLLEYQGLIVREYNLHRQELKCLPDATVS